MKKNKYSVCLHTFLYIPKVSFNFHSMIPFTMDNTFLLLKDNFY